MDSAVAEDIFGEYTFCTSANIRLLPSVITLVAVYLRVRTRWTPVIWSQFHMRTIALPACLAAALVSGAGTTASVSAQPPPARPPLQQQTSAAAADATQVRRISADDA